MRRIRLLGLLSLTACAGMLPQYQPMMLTRSATEADYAPYRERGTAMIDGQAFLTTRGGDVKVAAGREVTLDPKTPMAEEWYFKYGTSLSRWTEAPIDANFKAARRTTIADAAGKFRFTDLAPGTYYVRTTVTWETGSSYAGLQGGVVADSVTLAAGQVKSLILNKD